MTADASLSLRPFWRPRFWPTWLLWLALRIVAVLPFAWQMRLGRRIGRLLGRRRRERAIARRNLEICFPALGAAEREALLAKHFESVGLSLVEMAIGWYSPLAKLKRIVEVRGREHLDEALACGRGVIALGAHFTPLEVGVAIIEDFGVRCSCMYRAQRNAMMDVMIRRGRSRFAAQQIPRDNVRAMLKSLKRNVLFLYLPDQTHLGNQSALVPFFGEIAITNVATSKLARMSGAAVLTYFFRRREDDSGYVVEIGAPLTDFPSEDAVRDTGRFVALLERQIERAPDQYLWIYKKFKRRPAPLRDPYGA